MEKVAKKVYTLTQLNTAIESFIRNSPLSKEYWVTADITNLNEKGGHRYIELGDSINSKVSAKMKAFMWSRDYDKISYKLGSDITNIFKTGNKVLFLLTIEFHKLHGLKVRILDVDVDFELGKIEKKKRETIKRLKEEKLFHLQKEVYLPCIAKKIAIIGSPETSGFLDFYKELTQNNIYTRFKTIVFETTVEGDKAVKGIVQAIKNSQKYNIDVIVLVRGGGSPIALNIFNEYEIAKEICLCKKPILTGIGHETDIVVADLVCRLASKTPTAVALYLHNAIGVFKSQLREAFDRLKLKAKQVVYYKRETFSNLIKHFTHYSQRLIFRNKEILESKIHEIRLGFSNLISTEKNRLKLFLEKSLSASINMIRIMKETALIHTLNKIGMISLNEIKELRIKTNNLEQLLRLINPLQLLKRGYTISTINGKDLDLVSDNLSGKHMKTLSSNSVVTSTIIETKKTEKWE
jgi:exodeoxyribonuclease VII large subunit